MAESLEQVTKKLSKEYDKPNHKTALVAGFRTVVSCKNCGHKMGVHNLDEGCQVGKCDCDQWIRNVQTFENKTCNDKAHPEPVPVAYDEKYKQYRCKCGKKL